VAGWPRDTQEALDKLCSWASKWGMVFNVAKCKVLHMVSRNPGFNYTMNNQTLELTAEERDIGVMISENLKPAAQCAKAAKTALGGLGLPL
jgi:hypothetical protein